MSQQRSLAEAHRCRQCLHRQWRLQRLLHQLDRFGDLRVPRTGTGGGNHVLLFGARLSACPEIESYTFSSAASVIQPTDVAANWKIQVDNFLECQHCRSGHKSFADMLDIANQKQSLHENYAYAFIPSAGKADNMAYPLNPDYDVMDLHFWYLFPNLGFGQFSGPGNFGLFQWIPVAPDRAIRISVSLETPEATDPGMFERRERRANWSRDVLQPEDISFMESAHEGMSQRCFEHGWYLVDWDNQEISEVMVRHFHDLYLAHMGETRDA